MADRSNSERLRGFDNIQTDRRTDICDSRVAFATENIRKHVDPDVKQSQDTRLPLCNRNVNVTFDTHLIKNMGTKLPINIIIY